MISTGLKEVSTARGQNGVKIKILTGLSKYLMTIFLQTSMEILYMKYLKHLLKS